MEKYFALGVLLAIFVAYLVYMFILQRRFLKSCREEKQLVLFFQSPLGLPVGTVRSIIALIIITISIFFIGYGAFFSDGIQFPEALTAILGTVLGFYFGQRSSGRDQEQAVKDQIKQMQTDRDQALTDKEGAEVSNLQQKIQKGLALTRLAMEVLPPGLRKKYGGILSGLEKGAGLVEELAGAGDTSHALSKAKDAFDLFRTANPVLDVVTKAMGSFGSVLGGAVPPLVLIGTVVGIGARLTGVAYHKWKARILHLPFSPAVIPLDIVDDNTGYLLLMKSPILNQVFAKELDENDRDFMKTAVKEFLRTENLDSIWTRYKDRFESRAQFEDGVEEFRRAAADLELKKVIPASLTAETGGYDTLTENLDKIYANRSSRTDLDTLVMVMEELQRNGQPILSIFDKVRKEVSK